MPDSEATGGIKRDQAAHEHGTDRHNATWQERSTESNFHVSNEGIRFRDVQLLASLGHTGRRVVLGHTLNTLQHVYYTCITKNYQCFK